MEKTVSEAIAYRRSTRVYKDIPIDTEKVKQCLVNASLAPTSSNLQLWEFYHITNKNTLKEIAEACFNQSAAKTAQQLVIIVTRKDLWKQRAKANIAFLNKVYDKDDLSERELKRKKMATNYYKKLIPTIYTDFLGILGYLKYFSFQIVGLFKPIYRQVRQSDMRIVAHKSAGLAAQNFMTSMAAIGYDTCPMEGSDTLRVKRILNLPRGAEINMIIGCGIRDEKGIYGPRFRVPFEDVYFEI
ncbi:MAG: nitroreductase family protein [Flavobacteriaceae bacterium]|uniref:nitroreductase family protein n=1 Tax=Winogradskyella poriferorum TaxID=307627 RepID=UPI000C374BCB|nr:nitroreductase family protein [Flavobacteriaceae bacterium]MBD09223.1 nitroreductase family protein [Flavobacteriaceae bacterium]|tara:strand:+ start:3631 stop:4359 length:729 start_codon:yes stop_codon:yes gene_type:complete